MTTRFICGITLLAAVIFAPVPAAAQDASASSPPRSLIETFKQDLKSVVSKENGSVLSAATAFALLAQPFDKNLTYSASCSTFLKTTFDPWARVAGQEWLLAGGAAATYVYGRVAGNSHLAAVGGDLIEAEMIAGAGTHALKYATQRPRPDGEEFAFPSGHAAGTFAMATVLQRHYGLKAAVPAYTFAVLISGARLQANSHYPTDLIAGAALGILSGRAATFELGSRRLQMSPAAVRGGFGVTGSIH
jgi:membrane-associated phospholipid phosphatase